MAINVLRGDAVPTRKVLRVGPPPADQISGRFEFEIRGSGKWFAVEGWDAADIVAGWPTSIPEFREITPTAEDDALILTGPSDGTPFEIEVRASGYVSVETRTAGSVPVGETQRVRIPPATAGTFTLTYSGQTTAGIAYNATTAQVTSALEALSNIAPGEILVTQVDSRTWDVKFAGTLAGVEQAEMTLNTTGLTINTAALVTISTLREGTAGVAGTIELGGLDDPTGYVLTFEGSGQPALAITSATTAANVKTHLDSATGSVWTVTGGPTAFSGTAAAAPTIQRGAFKLTSNAVPADPTCWVNGSPGTVGVNEVQAVDLEPATGTFTLTFSGQTTAAINRDATTATVDTELEALSNITTVLVGELALANSVRRLLVEFTNPGVQNVAQMMASAAGLTATGSVTEASAHVAGVQEVQRITLPPAVTGGTFVLVFNGDRSTAIAYNATAATLDSALEGIEGIGAGGVTVAEVSPGVWDVTFATKADQPELEADASGLTVGTGELVDLVQAAAGPTHANDPLNWTELRPPESGDVVYADLPNLPLLHSLRWRTGFSLDDHEADTLVADGAMHFAEGQKVTLRTTGTLPGGLAAGDVYVRDPDEHHRTFKVSATRTGAITNLTNSAGAGTHTALVEFEEFHPTSRFSAAAGLPRRNALGYWEYRQRAWAFGLRGAKLVKVGEGQGSGSGRLILDLGTDQAVIQVLQTGGSIEGGVPACLIVNANDATTFEQEDGDTGIAAFPGETSHLGAFTVRGGNVTTGEGVTIDGPIRARPGSVAGRYLDSAGVEHRWE